MLKKTPSTDPSRILGKGPEFLRKQIERDGNKGRVSAVERLAASKPQYVKESGSVKQADEPDQEIVVRRVSSKKRDSILLHRQKCELLRGNCRKLIQKSVTEQTSAFSERKVNARESRVVLNGSAPEPRDRGAAETRERAGRGGVSRSSSDVSSRYSKNFADFDAFFTYCGLDGDVIESLGKANFSARSDDLGCRVRSVSVAASEDASSESGGRSDALQEDALQEDALQENSARAASVVERNARVIKWLYSCRNAEESGKTLRDLD